MVARDGVEPPVSALRSSPLSSCETHLHRRIERPKRSLDMRKLLATALVLFLCLLSSGFGSYRSQISQLPAGKLSGDTYANDAVGFTTTIPTGWTAKADPAGPTRIDVYHNGGPVNATFPTTSKDQGGVEKFAKKDRPDCASLDAAGGTRQR